MRRLDCHDRLKAVMGSYETARRTLAVFIAIVESDPAILYRNDLELSGIRALERELHSVFFARLFACFESALRHYWRENVRNSRPGTEQLLNAIAARLGVPQDTLDVAQEIRDFRNYLMHEEYEAEPKPFTAAQASAPLNTFLARLPLEW